MLGVAPTTQGKGVGHRLIEPVLARATADQVPCYLETVSPHARDFYVRHDFVVVDRAQQLANGPQHWIMRREPRPSAGTDS